MRVKKVAAALLCAALISGMTGMTALAVVETKISSVSLVVEADMEVGQNIQDQEIEVTPKSDKYSAGEYEFLNTGFSWSEEDIPVVKVSIYAEDGYKFAVSKDKITLKGATFVDYSREDESHTLVITMQLPPLAEQTSAIEQAAWTSTTGVSWSQSTGAGSYEVKLYRDGKTVGTTKTTAGNSYDFSAAMTKAGTYFYRVRPVNRLKPENKGEWVESPSRYIDNDTAAAIYQIGSPAGEWKQDESGWWYRNGDGTYTVSNWQQIDGAWYFFNERGYMATGWVDWNGKRYYCDAADGKMLVNTTTPDGYTVGADGALVQ